MKPMKVFLAAALIAASSAAWTQRALADPNGGGSRGEYAPASQPADKAEPPKGSTRTAPVNVPPSPNVHVADTCAGANCLRDDEPVPKTQLAGCRQHLRAQAA
jgi:hypothetical protein